MIVQLHVLVYISSPQFHMHLDMIRHVSIKLWLTDVCIIKSIETWVKVLGRYMGNVFIS